METPTLYRGLWPQNVSKLAKYAVRFVFNEWKITVLCEIGAGLRYLAVEGDSAELIARVNAMKTALGGEPGGTFYVNEYRHILVPIKSDPASGVGSEYYFAGRFDGDFVFEFDGKPLTTKPVHPDGRPLTAGERWIGPRPGIPYVLSAGGGDIHYETPALTDTDPPEIRPMTMRKVKLSKVLGEKAPLMRAVRPIANIRGHQGGRFYVNEHGAMFTPVDAGDGNGIDYIYCGNIDPLAWFPEPKIDV